MKKIFFVIVVVLFLSCNSSHFTMGELCGTYIGHERALKGLTGYNYQLELNKDSTCRLEKKHDIYNFVGFGQWYIQNNAIIVKFNTKSSKGMSDLLMGGGYIEGKKVIYILNKSKIQIGKSILKKEIKKAFIQVS